MAEISTARKDLSTVFPEKLSLFRGGTAVQFPETLVHSLRIGETVALTDFPDGIIGYFQFLTDCGSANLIQI